MKLRITGLAPAVVPLASDELDEEALELVEDDEPPDDDVLPLELDEDEEDELPDEVLPDEPPEEELFELKLPEDDLDADFVAAFDFALVVAVDWAAPLLPDAPALPDWLPEVVPLLVVPPLVLLLPEVEEFVPERFVPVVPFPVPPTMPSSASTSQRTIVLVALSSEPFSTTYSTMSPSSTSTSRSCSRSGLVSRSATYPDFQAP